MNTTARIKYPSATAGLQTRTVLTHSEERRKVSRASPWKTCVKIKAAETHIFWLLVSYMSKAQKVPERCCKCNSAASFIRLRHDLRVWCMNMKWSVLFVFKLFQDLKLCVCPICLTCYRSEFLHLWNQILAMKFIFVSSCLFLAHVCRASSRLRV